MPSEDAAGRWLRLLPGVAVLKGYRREWLRGDLLAGLTVTAYLIPQVMAYAQIAGLPPVVGLWGMCGPLLVYALVGSSRHLSVGPESTTAIMTAAGIGAVVASIGLDRRTDIAAALALVVGVVCLVGWLARLGFLANLLSRPVLQGYLVGVAVLMITGQLGKMTRLTIQGDDPISQVLSLARQVSSVHLPTLLVALGTLAFVIAVQVWRPTWPGPLIAMLLAGGLAALPAMSNLGLLVIGQIPIGLPPPALPDLTGINLWALVPSAVGIAIVGYSDNVLTGRAFAARHREHVDAGQEMFALGLINVAAGLSHGFPSSSSGSRTVLGDSMGSRTQLYSLVTLVGVVLVLVVAGPVLASFPLGAMAAIIVYAALRLIDIAEIRRIAEFRVSELALVLVTAVGVVWLGVLAGIGLAVGLSLLDLIRRIADPHDGILGYVPGVAGMHDVADWPVTTRIEGLLVYRYDAPLFFANASNFVERCLAAADATPPPLRWVLLNAEANIEVDLTAVDALEDLRQALKDRGVVLALARVKQETRDQLREAGFVDAVGTDRIYETLPTAVAAYAAWFEAEVGRPPLGLPPRA